MMPKLPGMMEPSELVPFDWRLFPRHPGYVMTVCAEASDADRSSVIVDVNCIVENMGVGVDVRIICFL